MADLREIPGVGPEAGALDLLGRVAEQITAGELKVDGLMVVWYSDEGYVDFEHSEHLGIEHAAAMATAVQREVGNQLLGRFEDE